MGKLEELAGMEYGDPLLTVGDHEEDRDGYRLQWTVSDGPMDNTKQIDMQASWTEKGFMKRVNLTGIKVDII